MLREASERWPRRDKAGDGICSSAAHRARDAALGIHSDHDAGNAVDLTQDPAHGVDCNVLAEHVIRDVRVKYVIWNRRIFNREQGVTHWRPYTVPGGDPHTGHMHVSILSAFRKDIRPWFATPQQEDDLTDEEHKLLERAVVLAQAAASDAHAALVELTKSRDTEGKPGNIGGLIVRIRDSLARLEAKK